MADEQYDHNFFKKFRSQCGLEAAIYFACNSNWEAVAALFTYHGEETLTHRLAVLSNFPETTSPIEYQSLLPLFKYVSPFTVLKIKAELKFLILSKIKIMNKVK